LQGNLEKLAGCALSYQSSVNTYLDGFVFGEALFYVANNILQEALSSPIRVLTSLVSVLPQMAVM